MYQMTKSHLYGIPAEFYPSQPENMYNLIRYDQDGRCSVEGKVMKYGWKVFLFADMKSLAFGTTQNLTPFSSSALVYDGKRFETLLQTAKSLYEILFAAENMDELLMLTIDTEDPHSLWEAREMEQKFRAAHQGKEVLWLNHSLVGRINTQYFFVLSSKRHQLN